MVMVGQRKAPFLDGAEYHMMLNLTQEAKNNVNWIWNNFEPTSTVFGVGRFGISNQNGDNFIAYCFHSVDGFSKIGSYTGTGAAGNTIVTGFEPAFVMVKQTSNIGTDNHWNMWDNKRVQYDMFKG